MQVLYLLVNVRLLIRNLKLHLPIIDSNVFLAEIANRGHVSEKAYRRALQLLSIVKGPDALAVAVLDAACLKEREKVSQAQIDVAGDTRIVTLRKRFQDVRKIFP
jgi:transcription initiation factor TFIIB